MTVVVATWKGGAATDKPELKENQMPCIAWHGASCPPQDVSSAPVKLSHSSPTRLSGIPPVSAHPPFIGASAANYGATAAYPNVLDMGARIS